MKLRDLTKRWKASPRKSMTLGKRLGSGTPTMKPENRSYQKPLNGTGNGSQSTESGSGLSRVRDILRASETPLTESPQIRTIVTVTAGILIGIAYAVKEIVSLFQ